MREANGVKYPISIIKYPCSIIFSEELRSFHKSILQTVSDLLNCNFDNIPASVLSHQFIFDGLKSIPWKREYSQCLGGREPVDEVSPRCLQVLETHCNKAPLRAMKTVRFSLHMASKLLELDPDIKVIYLVRDPRGVLKSRFTNHAAYIQDPRVDIKELCYQMGKDWESLQMLKARLGSRSDRPSVTAVEKNYGTALSNNSASAHDNMTVYFMYHHPVIVSDRFMYLRYEDMTFEPLKTGKVLYQFAGVKMPPFPALWMDTNTRPLTPEEASYGVMRSAMAAFKWRVDLPLYQQIYFTEQCKSLLEKWGYALM